MSFRSTSIPFKLVYLVRLGEDILHHYGAGVVLARDHGCQLAGDIDANCFGQLGVTDIMYD